MKIVLLLLLAGTQQPAGLGVWDTGQSSSKPLAAQALRDRSGWTPVEKADAEFKGDAVLSNGRITAVIRRLGSSVELYGASADQARLVLQAAGGDAAQKLERAALVENGKGSVALEAAWRTAKGTSAAAKFRLKKQDVSLETEPAAGAARLRVECSSRFLVLPDFFADDIVIDARRLPSWTAEVPSENFLLHLCGKGDALVAAVFENHDQDARITLSGQGEKRTLTGSEIEFGKDHKKVWVAVLEGAGLWHSFDVKPGDSQKVVPLDWRMPFAAQWRADFTRKDELVDSWEMLLQEKKDAEYLKPHWFGSGMEKIDASRKRWTTVLGTFKYPCWTDPDRRGYVEALETEALAFRGAAVIYPINRVPATPLEAFTIVDLLRNSLGVGPCEYILDLEGQKNELKGWATCATRDFLEGIYKNGQQKEKRAEIEKRLTAVMDFVAHIRGRIELYAAFGRKIREYTAQQRKAHPELKSFLDEMDRIAQGIDTKIAARKEQIKTLEVAAGMVDDFRRTMLDYAGADALEKCKKFTRPMVEIGGNQDELAAECRWVVKTLRQRAGMLMAMDPRAAAVAEEIRARAQEVLRNPAHHESARH